MTLPAYTDIDALLAFLPGFREPGRRFLREEPSAANGWAHLYEADVVAFFRVASAECWMDRDCVPDQATTLLADRSLVTKADLLTLRMLVTACVRGERLSDGWWASILQDGTLQAVLERLAAIRGDRHFVHEPETVESLFAWWRACANRRVNWGLAWYLSYEICRRYYRSHGIAPFVINHDGLGYYGISLVQLPCDSAGVKNQQGLGRLTMAGNVENWIVGGHGDHGCELVEPCAEGESATKLLAHAIRHLGLLAVPTKPHNHCHHKRRGDLFVLLWEIATVLALRVDLGRTNTCLLANGLEHDKPLAGLDDSPMTYQKPAYFRFGGARGIYVTDEGALCDGSGENLWKRHMAGQSPAELATWLQERAGEGVS